MIEIVDSNKINNLNDYVVIIPSNYDVYYKQKYLNEDVNIITLKNFILNNYNGSKRLVSKEENFVLMYEALKKVKESLILYKDILSNSFISELVNTYDSFKNYVLHDNSKIKDLKLIYDNYEELLLNKGLINENMLYEYVINNYDFDDKYLFLNLSDIDDNTFKLIKKMSNITEVLISIDGHNKNLENKLRRIDSNIKIDNLGYLNENNLNYKLLNDVIDEVSFISNDISKKIMEGYNYKDFLIVSNNINQYYPYFNTIFNHPYSKKDIKGILTSRFISILCNILKGDFTCKNFIDILKLDVFNVDINMIDKLDNYIYSWDLEDTNFYLPFIFNPNGNKKIFNVKDNEDLGKLNNVKDSVISPIKYLLENLVNENNKTEILRNLYTYLNEEGIIEKLFKKDEEGALKLINVFDTLHDNLSDEIRVNEVINILSGLDFTTEKNNAMQDEITISNLNDAIYEDKKFIYIIGAVNDNIPKTFSISGLLNESDLTKECLINLVEEHLSNEEYLFEKAISNMNVTITYHKLGLDLKLKNPSIYLSNLKLKEINLDKLYNKDLILNNYALLLSDDKIKKIESESFDKINHSNNHDLNYKLTKENAKRLYGNEILLSPSAIETYAKCPFYHFCEKGLRLKVKEKYTFDNREVGTFVHYVLEKIIKNDLDDITNDNLDEYIYKYSKNYLEENGKIVNNTSSYIIKKLSENVSLIIKNMIKERSITSFKPKYFEFKIDDESLVKPVVIDLTDGSLKISGIVDRVDVCEDNDNYYYRIIDYKTGEKKFRLDDVLMGLNLQMLLYLLAIKENSKNLTNKNIVPAGLLYYPALVKESLSSRSLTKEQKEVTIKDKLKMNGIINKDDSVINYLGNDDIGEFISVTTRGKLNEEYLFGIKELELIFENIKATLKQIGNDMKNGVIKVSPIGGRIDSCLYCKYSCICKFDFKNDKRRKPVTYKNSEVIKMLEGDNDA